MNNELLTLLPELILLEDYRGNWNAYLEAIYQSFHTDFIGNRPFFQNASIFVRYHPAFNNKGATFWHLISEGSQESDRIPDLRRCERICWPKAIIENSLSLDIKIWETFRPWKGQDQRRFHLALTDFSYLVVIAETTKGCDLITAYPVERLSNRNKLEQEFEGFSKQKKEGSAV